MSSRLWMLLHMVSQERSSTSCTLVEIEGHHPRHKTNYMLNARMMWRLSKNLKKISFVNYSRVPPPVAHFPFTPAALQIWHWTPCGPRKTQGYSRCQVLTLEAIHRSCFVVLLVMWQAQNKQLAWQYLPQLKMNLVSDWWSPLNLSLNYC